MINSGAIAYLLLWVRQVCQTKDGFFFFKYILRGRESGVFLWLPEYVKVTESFLSWISLYTTWVKDQIQAIRLNTGTFTQSQQQIFLSL